MTNDNAAAPADAALLASIRTRRAAITPGKWTALTRPMRPGAVLTDTPWPNSDLPSIAEEMSHDDAKFLASAPADIDALLALVDALTARIAALDDALTEPYRAGEALAASWDGLPALTVAYAQIEGHYPYRWHEEGGGVHTVTNIVTGGVTDQYEIWFADDDPDGWAIVPSDETLMRGNVAAEPYRTGEAEMSVAAYASPRCPVCHEPLMFLRGIPHKDANGKPMLNSPAKAYEYGCATCDVYMKMPPQPASGLARLRDDAPGGGERGA